MTIGLTVITAITSSLLAIDDDDSWYRNVVGRQARRERDRVETDVPGIVFFEIDGLAYEISSRALRDGTAPNLSGWVRDGSHRFERWETDWSSQTGACQAGLLHGSNHDMPAFRWWEKDRGAAIVTNHPRDAEEIERRHSDGRGLLHADGASRANILSGDAPHSMLTMSTVLRRRRPIGRDYAAYFARPTRSRGRSSPRLPRSPASAARGARQRRDDVRPGSPARASTRRCAPGRRSSNSTSRSRRWSTTCSRGGRSIYTTFLAYDEVAHHSGIERAGHARRAAPRSTARSAGSPPPPMPRRAPTGSSSSPTTVSRRARPSCSATG